MSETEPILFRFSKFYLETLFDGHLHLVRRGVDFPAHWAREEVAKRLRNAAWWRGTTVRLSHCPQGVWVQSADGLDELAEAREQLKIALEENTRLKEHNTQLRRENWKLQNP